MGANDDVRNVMQDFLAPELRELKVRIDAVERQVRERELQDLARRVSAAEDQLRRVAVTDEVERNG